MRLLQAFFSVQLPLICLIFTQFAVNNNCVSLPILYLHPRALQILNSYFFGDGFKVSLQYLYLAM